MKSTFFAILISIKKTEMKENKSKLISFITTIFVYLFWVSAPCYSQMVQMSRPVYDEYTEITTCTVTNYNITITKAITPSGMASYALSLSNKVKIDPYATSGIPFSDVHVPYDKRNQGAILLFTDQTRLNLTMNFVEDHFNTKLSLAQFNTMKSKKIKGVRLLESKWDYEVEESERVLMQERLQLLSKSMTEIRKIQKEEDIAKEKANEAREREREIQVRKMEEELREKENREENQTAFDIVENMPDFPGGQAALMQYLAKNIKYPAIAKENGTQGRVIVQVIIDRDGSITEPKIERSVDRDLDREAIRVVQSMPKWKPGMQRGKAVRVKFTIPVMFRMQ